MKNTISMSAAIMLSAGCSTYGYNNGSDADDSVESALNPIHLVRPDAPELATLGDQATGIMTLEFWHEGQLDAANATAEGVPEYDRDLTVEIWYPAEPGAAHPDSRSTRVMTRDGETEATLTGRAVRDASPQTADQPYPLIVLSHGYPGNRFLMSHFGENLASKGFVVASIDHQESTYQDQGEFISTLLHRPLDQLFVIDQLAQVNAADSHPLSGLIDADNTGLIGFSMGGYGAINAIGGGLSAGVTELPFASPEQMAVLSTRQLNHPDYAASVDPRIRAAVTIGPWGNQNGLWDSEGLSNIEVPVMVMGGSVDDVSDYENGIKPLYDSLQGIDRYLLTFEAANHNAAATNPAPREVHATGVGFDHYADAVWDTTRMNNIAQHFATAFFDQYLKGADRGAYLELIERADAGDEEAGATWAGFDQRDAKGLIFEYELQ